MSDLVKILPGENKYLSVTWQVNNFCNYKCSYCNEGNWSGTHKNDDTEKYIDFLINKLQDFNLKVMNHLSSSFQEENLYIGNHY